jgi:DDE superfamily endonuclease
MIVNKITTEIICTNYRNGKCHDYRLFKESKVRIHPKIKVAVDTGYQGLQKVHAQTMLPKKKSKRRPLTNEDKKENTALAKERVVVENVIGMLKRFKIISDRYRNRRKRFGLRFSLLAGLYNFELKI